MKVLSDRMSVDGLHVYSGKKKLLTDVSGTMAPRSIMLLGGPSGSGKTVFLNAITGRSGLRAEGNISIQPHEFVYVRTHVDYYTRTFTVREEVWFAAAMYAGGPVQEDRIDGVLESVGLTQVRDRYIGELSTGQRKRLSIACALTKPSVRCLILDEPTSNLDSSSAVAIMQAIKDTVRRMENVSVICSVHQPSSLVLSFFDTALLLCHGHCVYHGTMGEPMYETLREYSQTCIDYETVQYALSQDPTESSSLFAKWEAKHNVSKDKPKRSFRDNLLAHTRSLQSIRIANLLKFEKNTTLSSSLYRLKYLLVRTMLLFIKDWRRETARILLILTGWILGSVINGRPTFAQENVLPVIAVIRSVTYFQGMTGVSRVVNRNESDRVSKDCIDNGMYSRGQYEIVMFLNTVFAAFLAAFVSIIVSVWLFAPFSFMIWFAYALYFIFVDSLYSLAVRATGSVAVAAIGTLTYILVCSSSPVDSTIFPTTEIFRYTQSAFMSTMNWKPCDPHKICYGGQDPCVILEVATFSECDQSATATLLSSAIWTFILVVTTRLIKM